jgi:signal transduction histidine kinase
VRDRTFVGAPNPTSGLSAASRSSSKAKAARMQDRSASLSSLATPADSASRAPAGDRGRLLSQFIAAGEQERRRLAEGIHDDSIQAMAALGMRLQMLRRTLSEAKQLAFLSEAEQAVQLTIARLRHLVFELHPPGLEQEGLSVALALALDAQRTPAVDCRLIDRLQTQPTTEASAVLFRIAQEALENVHQHASASTISVTLLERHRGHALLVVDDGCGFDPALAAPGSSSAGFAAMRTRAELGGGTVRVESAPGAGTTVEAWLPQAVGVSPAPGIGRVAGGKAAA